MLKSVVAGVLDLVYQESGNPWGWPVVLLHGFPYDIHAYDEVAPRLAAAGARVIVPYLRGYGPTRFRSEKTPRSGQQAALGSDLLVLLDTLAIERALLAGYDWGGRAACIAAALWPERVDGLVSVNGYNVQNIARSGEPSSPEHEYRLWYQYYFHSERGRAGFARNRHVFCKLLWRLWSPRWAFDDDTYERTAASFDNPDFVEVVIHSYIATVSLSWGTIQPMRRSSAASPPNRRSPCRRSRWTATPTAWRGSAAAPAMPLASRAVTSTGSSPVQDTTCRRKCRRSSPRRCSP